MLTKAQIDAIVAWSDRRVALGGASVTDVLRRQLVEIVGGEGEPYDARARVLRLVDDLADRRGLGGEWWGIDEGIRDEILEVWTRIVAGAPQKADRVRAHRAARELERAGTAIAEHLDAICDGAAMFPEAYPDMNVATAEGPVGVDALRSQVVAWEESLAEAKHTGILP